MKPLLITLGTFLPIIGLVLTAVLVIQTTGKARSLALWLGPGLTLGASLLLGKIISYNGNMLFVLLLCLLFIFAIIYYPVIAVMHIIRHFKEPDE